MRKNCIFLLLLTGTALCGAAQSNSSALVATDSVVIYPEGHDRVLKKLPFKNIVLLDRRFDTLKAGYVKKGGSYKKIVTQNSFSQTMQAYLQQQYNVSFDTTSPYTLVVVLKNLWLQETSAAEQEHHKIERSSEATMEFSSCTGSYEAYAATGDMFIPIFRQDSLYIVKRGLKQCARTLLIKPFEDCLARTADLNVSKMAGAKRKLTWVEVEAYNNRRLQYPRFETDIVVKGIYKTFQDFLNNQVAKQEFSIEYGPHTDEVFVQENGKSILLTDFWGLCDGAKNYIHIGYNIFELARQNNTYDIWGSKLSVHKFYRYSQSNPKSVSDALVGSALWNRNRVVTEKKPLQLNMETGEVY